MMVNEPSYLEALAAIIEDQNKQIRTLKRRIAPLSKRIEDIEVLDFQAQLNALDDNIRSVDTRLASLETLMQGYPTAIEGYVAATLLPSRRFLADTRLQIDDLWLEQWLRSSPNALQSQPCLSRVREITAQCIGFIENSDSPETVNLIWRERCKVILAQFGYAGYFA